MHINEVESIVKLSKKSIRYYEKEGLINPTRNGNNDYREYSEDDIRELKTIKFLRELGVPIKELKLLKENKLTLQECLQDRLQNIEFEEEQFKKIKNMCLEIINSNDTYENIDITNYFHEINILNKEGFTMNQTKSNKVKKIVGALIPSLIFGSFFIIFVIALLAANHFGEIPLLMFIPMLIIVLLPLLGIVYNFIIRVKEILGGEEDEASKY